MGIFRTKDIKCSLCGEVFGLSSRKITWNVMCPICAQNISFLRIVKKWIEQHPRVMKRKAPLE
jgi:hypothetical protein